MLSYVDNVESACCITNSCHWSIGISDFNTDWTFSFSLRLTARTLFSSLSYSCKSFNMTLVTFASGPNSKSAQAAKNTTCFLATKHDIIIWYLSSSAMTYFWTLTNINISGWSESFLVCDSSSWGFWAVQCKKSSQHATNSLNIYNLRSVTPSEKV